MGHLHRRFQPAMLGGELEERLLLHRASAVAQFHIQERLSSSQRHLPLSVSTNAVNANFASFSQLVTSYVNVLFNFNGSFPSPGISGATMSKPDGTLLLSSNYNQSITSITSELNQAVAISISSAPIRPGTSAVISERIAGSSPGSLVSQLTAIPVSSLASQGQSSSSARTAAFVPITQAISSAQMDVIDDLLQGALPTTHHRLSLGRG